ncbi:MAG: hypothetical protein ACKVOW_15795 [Chitinophagaceae bacterium]
MKKGTMGTPIERMQRILTDCTDLFNPEHDEGHMGILIERIQRIFADCTYPFLSVQSVSSVLLLYISYKYYSPGR